MPDDDEHQFHLTLHTHAHWSKVTKVKGELMGLSFWKKKKKWGQCYLILPFGPPGYREGLCPCWHFQMSSLSYVTPKHWLWGKLADRCVSQRGKLVPWEMEHHCARIQYNTGWGKVRYFLWGYYTLLTSEIFFFFSFFLAYFNCKSWQRYRKKILLLLNYKMHYFGYKFLKFWIGVTSHQVTFVWGGCRANFMGFLWTKI